MTIRKFIWGTDQNRDSTGWIAKGMPHFDAVLGQGVAHDAIEHFALKEGIENEMLAFGAIIYIRGVGGYLHLTATPGSFQRNRNYYDYGWHLSSDFARFLAESGANISAPRNTDPLDDEQAEDIIASMLAFAHDSIDDEMDNHGAEFDKAVVMYRAADWIRCGYRAAQKRFGNHAPEEVCYMFYEIQNEVDRDYATGEEGDQLIVEFSTETLRYTIARKHANPWNEYA